MVGSPRRWFAVADEVPSGLVDDDDGWMTKEFGSGKGNLLFHFLLFVWCVSLFLSQPPAHKTPREETKSALEPR